MNKPFQITKPGKYAVKGANDVSHVVIESIGLGGEQPCRGKIIWRDKHREPESERWGLDGLFFHWKGATSCLDIVGQYNEPNEASQPSARTIRRRFLATLRKHAPGLSPAAVAAIVKAANLPKG